MKTLLLGAIVLATLAACQHGMKSEVQFAEGKNKVTTVPLAGSNIYFIQGEQGYLMVDTGMGARGKAVDEIFSSTGIEPAK